MLRLFSLLTTIAGLLFLAHSQAMLARSPESASPTQQVVSTTPGAEPNGPASQDTSVKGPEGCPQDRKLIGADLDFAERLNDCGLSASKRGDLATAERFHGEALEIRQKLAPSTLQLAESLNHLGDVEGQLGYLDKAQAHERKALAIRRSLTPDSQGVAETLHSLGRTEMARGDLSSAEVRFREALRIRQRFAPGGHELALSFIDLVDLFGRRGDVEEQEEYFQQALDLGEKLTPLDRAAIFEGLGNGNFQRGQLQRAEDYFRKALGIRQTLLPESLPVATNLSNLGNLALRRGDRDLAEQCYRQSFEIRQKVAPRSLWIAASFRELGSIAGAHGNLADAERYSRKALKIDQQLAPGSLAVAYDLQGLGVILWSREDLSTAESDFRRALEIAQRVAPESPGAAQSLIWLGLVFASRGDISQAEEYFNHALQISQTPPSDNLVVPQILNNLGVMERRQEDLAKAEGYFRHSLAIQHKLAPNSPGEASVLQELGGLERKRRNLPKAEGYFRQALALREKTMPGSPMHVGALLALASLLWQEHKTDEASQMYEEATNILDNQMSVLGGSEQVRSTFRANHEVDYKDYIDLLVADAKKPEQAFNVVERSRARTLLELLESAQLDIHKGCSPGLLRRERSLRDLISAKSSYRLELLDAVHTENTVAALDLQIQKLRDQYEDVKTEIRLESPAYAALTQPRPLTAQDAQKLLDADTVLLEFSLGDRRSYVWALTSTALAVYTLPPQKVIEAAAHKVYELLTARSRRVARETAQQRRIRIAEADTEYTRVASELSQMILGPVASTLGNKRLLIVSDGTLQYLPFGALPIPLIPASQTLRKSSGAKDAVRPPLISQNEIVSLPSISVLAELRRARMNRREPPKAVAVFADPVFDPRDERVAQPRTAVNEPPTPGSQLSVNNLSLSAQRLIRSATDLGLIRTRGEYLGRLLWTGREAAAILRVTPSGEGMQALGFDANRSTAINPALAQYRIVHFATHALLDSKNPELSGLVLSLVDRDGRPQDGFLDLEQIYNLNLPVDLVVLSACDTALGQEVRGEGLIGLARGFIYAGASRVMASLWSVDDEVTSELMARFYWSMEQGKMSPAAALRAAQIEVAKVKRWSSPYYWAGFQIQGEWK